VKYLLTKSVSELQKIRKVLGWVLTIFLFASLGGVALYYINPILLYLVFGMDGAITVAILILSVIIIIREKQEEKTEQKVTPKEIDYNAMVSEAIKIAEDPVKSEELLGKPLSIESNYYYWYSMGGQLGTMGKLNLSLFCFNKAIELNPGYSLSWSNKGLTLLRMNKWEEALECQEKALEINPWSYKVWSDKSTSLARLQRFSESIEAANKALELNEEDYHAWIEKGYSEIKMNKIPLGFESLQKALEIDPENEDANTIIRQTREFQSELAQIEEKLKLYPQNENLIIQKADILRRLGDRKFSLKLLNIILDDNPQSIDAWEKKAALYLELKEYQKTIKCLENLIEYHPEHAKSWGTIGFCYFRLSQPNSALENLNKALQIDPNFIAAQKTLRMVEAELTKSSLESETDEWSKEIDMGLQVKRYCEKIHGKGHFNLFIPIDFEYQENFPMTRALLTDCQEEEQNRYIKGILDVVIPDENISVNILVTQSGKMVKKTTMSQFHKYGYRKINVMQIVFSWAQENLSAEILKSLVLDTGMYDHEEKEVSITLKRRFDML